MLFQDPKKVKEFRNLLFICMAVVIMCTGEAQNAYGPCDMESVWQPLFCVKLVIMKQDGAKQTSFFHVQSEFWSASKLQVKGLLWDH